MNENIERMELARRTEMENPFQMMRRFTKEMERLFEDFQGFGFRNSFKTEFAPFSTEFDKVEWLPQIEVLQNNDQFTVRADLPGLAKEDVKVEVTKELLTLSGERKEEKEEQGESLFRSERKYGSFYRQIPLPEGAKVDNAVATFHNGVLEVTMPTPKMETSTRKLEIKETPPEKKSVVKAAGA